jgi:FtsP/CotA-like multicopper oxidase with cupredoxin domain
MYAFAVVVLLGIGITKLLDAIGERANLTPARSLLTIVTGVLVAWALDFSLFAAWSLPVRSQALGYIGTGLMIAAAGYLVPQFVGAAGDVVTARTHTRVGKAA